MTRPLWPYSDPEYVQARKEGKVSVDPATLVEDFKAWCKEDVVSFIRNKETGEVFMSLNSKRGNPRYAHNKQKQMEPLMEAMASKPYDFPYHMKGFRDGQVRKTHALFITFTIDQNQYEIEEAWENLTAMLNNFKAWLRKYLGCGFGCFTVKESTVSGYPAPHMILLLDEPVVVYHYKQSRWILQDIKVKETIQKAWGNHSRGSFCDIQGIAGGREAWDRKVRYLAKYFVKSVDLSSPTAVNTHAWQKYYNVRDVAGQSFKKRLGIEREPPSRLDILCKNLKLKERELLDLMMKEGAFGFILSDIPYRIADLEREMYDLQEQIRQESPPSPWEFVESARARCRSDWNVINFRFVDLAEGKE